MEVVNVFMEEKAPRLTLHPSFLEILFAYKRKVSSIFRDVLGLHNIDHIAVNLVTKHHQLLALSSTPALEFNLFNSGLWRFDKSYDQRWFSLCQQAHWSSLYHPKRYDELYYLKQIKHRYSTGYSLASRLARHSVIYSIASKKNTPISELSHHHKQDELYQIGHYCLTSLLPIIYQCDSTFLSKIDTQESNELFI